MHCVLNGYHRRIISREIPLRQWVVLFKRGQLRMYAVKNKYYKHSKLDEQCFRRILELFAMDLTAVQCANLTGVNVRSVNTIFLKLRDRIAQWSEANASGMPGLNAQLSAGALVSGTNGRGSAELVSHGPRGQLARESVSYVASERDGVISVRLFVHSDQVYCALMASQQAPGDSLESARTPARNFARSESDNDKPSRWNEYQIGIDVKRDMRFKLKSLTFQQAYHAGETERIDAFGRFLRLRLGKFKGLRREKFYFHLKESEYRYNHRRYELYALLLGMLGEAPIE